MNIHVVFFLPYDDMCLKKHLNGGTHEITITTSQNRAQYLCDKRELPYVINTRQLDGLRRAPPWRALHSDWCVYLMREHLRALLVRVHPFLSNSVLPGARYAP